ncbi:MAG: AAA family ATPase, partial [Chlamydiales bacterium]
MRFYVFHHLSIKNLALIEEAEITFSSGLNILTGETGAGKTILLSALAFILGKRVPATMVREGEEKAIVEAAFDLPASSPIFSLLSAHEINHDPDDLLLLRRELSKEGKSRTQINRQTVPLHLLQEIASSLCDFVDQSSHQELRQPEHQREELDLYADLKESVQQFASTLAEERTMSSELDLLLKQNERRDQEIELARFQLDELEKADLGEEERCFEEYQTLSKRKELLEKVYGVHTALCDSPQALLSQLLRLKNPLEAAAKIDPALQEAVTCFHEALLPLNEVGAILSRNLDAKEADPKRLQHLEEKLSEMHQIKRKLGIQTQEQAKEQENTLREKLEMLNVLEEKIQELREKVGKSKEKTDALAHAITKQRKEAALTFAKKLTDALRPLNMQEAEVAIQVEQTTRSTSGDDLVTFFMQANHGEAKIPIQTSASGGELSRLFLVLKT